MFTTEQFILLAIAAFVLWALWRACGKRWTICIQAGPQHVEIVRGVAIAQRSTVANFFRYDVVLSGAIQILALKDYQGRLQMKIVGELDDELRQRIRNFLISVL